MLHLAVVTGSLTITLVLVLTPTGHKLASIVWDWVKGLLKKGKEAASSKLSIFISIYKEDNKGNRTEVVISTENTRGLLKQFPIAAGGNFPTPPNFSLIPTQLPYFLPSPKEHSQHPIPASVPAPKSVKTPLKRKKRTRKHQNRRKHVRFSRIRGH